MNQKQLVLFVKTDRWRVKQMEPDTLINKRALDKLALELLAQPGIESTKVEVAVEVTNGNGRYR